MWRIKFINQAFRNEGVCDLYNENCPKCEKADLKYPMKWRGACCPDCGVAMPGKMLYDHQYTRKHYHFQLEYSAIGKILLCTN